MTSISRRKLATTAAGLLPLSMLSRMAMARSGQPPVGFTEDDAHFFLFVQVYGAWDVCLAFDPKDRNATYANGDRITDQPYEIGDVQEYNGIKLAPDGQVLSKYADKMAIINGIDMEADGGHTSDTIMTGVQTARATNAPYLQAMIAKRHPFLKRRAVPHLYTSYDGQFIGGSYALSSISASPADFLNVIGSGSGENNDTATLKALLGEYQGSLASAISRRTFGSYVNAVDNALSVTKSLKDFGFHPPADITVPAGVGSFLGQMFASGVLGSATISLGQTYFFDTHSNHYADHPLGKALVDMDVVIQALATVPLNATESVLDRTTIVFTGEYARSPKLNTSAGKDHNFRTNSIVAIGHQVPAGVYGLSGPRQENGSYEGHCGLPIDFATGKPNESGQMLYGRNVWAGFKGITGVDISGDMPAGTVPVTFLG